MDPFTLMAITGGLQILGGMNQAAQKKKQMLTAAEQTRYSPWTGESGSGAFNDAMKIDPFGSTVKGIAGTAAGAFAQQSADKKNDMFMQALMAAKSAPGQAPGQSGGSFNRVAASPLGGNQMAANLGNSGFQMDDGSTPWNKMYSLTGN